MNMSVELGPIVDVPNIKLRRARARSQSTDLKTIPESKIICSQSLGGNPRNLIEQCYCKLQFSIQPLSLRFQVSSSRPEKAKLRIAEMWKSLTTCQDCRGTRATSVRARQGDAAMQTPQPKQANPAMDAVPITLEVQEWRTWHRLDYWMIAMEPWKGGLAQPEMDAECVRVVHDRSRHHLCKVFRISVLKLSHKPALDSIILYIRRGSSYFLICTASSSSFCDFRGFRCAIFGSVATGLACFLRPS